MVQPLGLAVSYEIKYVITIAFVSLSISQRNKNVCSNTYTLTFIVAVFIITQNWKQPTALYQVNGLKNCGTAI